jgi:putative ABC transport system ATP-binding protein
MPSIKYAPTLIDAKSVSKQFTIAHSNTPLTVLDGVSLQVRPNEFVAIVGSSGSGKSTLLYCLSGLERVTDGRVSLVGEPLRYQNESAELTTRQSSGIGFIFQSYQLLKFLTVRENIMLPSKYNNSYKKAEAQLLPLLKQLDLEEKIDAKVSELSGGQQQRVAIARALINEPSVVFADEPTGALDTKNATEVASILKTIPNAKRSVVMVTHDLEMAAQASRVLVLSDGKIITELGPSSAPEILAAMRSGKESGNIA